MRLHVEVPAAVEEALSIGQDHERAFVARDALRQILAKASPRDGAMMLRLAIGHTSRDVACSVGLTEVAVRKRLSRLRDEFAFLDLQAA
jgi:FixJ family two-component response regulator